MSLLTPAWKFRADAPSKSPLFTIDHFDGLPVSVGQRHGEIPPKKGEFVNFDFVLFEWLYLGNDSNN